MILFLFLNNDIAVELNIVSFDFRAKKMRTHGENDQKVIKNRLLKTGVRLVIGPFLSILEPKNTYTW